MAAKKAARKKAPKAPKEEKRHYPEGAKIEVLAEKNPKREGTGAFKRFELFRSGMLVDTYFKNGGKIGSLKRAIQKKLVKVNT